MADRVRLRDQPARSAGAVLAPAAARPAGVGRVPGHPRSPGRPPPGPPPGRGWGPSGAGRGALSPPDGTPKPAPAPSRPPPFAAGGGPPRRPVALVWGRLRGTAAGTARVELRTRAASW